MIYILKFFLFLLFLVTTGKFLNEVFRIKHESFSRALSFYLFLGYIFNYLAIVLFSVFLAEFSLIPHYIAGFLGFLFFLKDHRKHLYFQLPKIPSLFILAQFIFILFSAYWRPVSLNDEWLQWGENPQYLFYSKKLSDLYFNYHVHPDYPWQVIANKVVYALMFREWNDFLSRTFQIGLFLSFCIRFADFIKSKYSIPRVWGWLIPLSLPYFARMGIDGTAEVYMSLLVGLILMEFLDVLILKNISFSHRKIILLIFAIYSTKNEGVIVAGLLLMLYLFLSLRQKISFRTISQDFLIFIACIAPWEYIKFIFSPHNNHLERASWLYLFKSEKYLVILKSFASILLLPSTTFAYLNFFTFVFLLINFTKKRITLTSNFLLACILIIATMYAVGSCYVGWPTEFARIITHMTGAFLILFIDQGYLLYKSLNLKIAHKTEMT